MSGVLLAEFRYGHTAHIRATKIKNAWWFRVRLGKKRMITCDCGGAVKDNPNAMSYDESWGGCSHIVALYKGNVTRDEREDTGAFRVNRTLWEPIGPSVHFARLTERGQKMFAWRWVAKALS